METIKSKAWQQLVLLNITTLNYNIEEVIETKFGYTILPYCDEKANEIIDILDLKNYTKQHNALTISSSIGKVILYNEKIALEDKKFILAHELGHIVLHHTSYSSVLGLSSNDFTYDIQEKEANIFALNFIAPAPVLLAMNIKSNTELSRILNVSINISNRIMDEIRFERSLDFSLISNTIVSHFDNLIKEYKSKKLLTQKQFCVYAFLFATFFISLTLIINIIAKSTSTNSSKIRHTTLEQQNVGNEKYFVTATGSKYHVTGCQYLKNSSIEITIDEINKLEYKPCSVCIKLEK